MELIKFIVVFKSTVVSKLFKSLFSRNIQVNRNYKDYKIIGDQLS